MTVSTRERKFPRPNSQLELRVTKFCGAEKNSAFGGN